MKRIKFFLSSALSACSAIAFFETIEPLTAYAQTQPIIPCTQSVTPLTLTTSICTSAAQTYGITFYQIAICTNNPLTTSNPDTSSCFFLYNNSSGQYIDIGAASPNYRLPVTLSSTPKELRPNGDYPFIYVLWSNTVLIKGTATISNGTYYTTNAAYIPSDTSLTGNGAVASTNPALYAAFPSSTLRIDGTTCFSNNNGAGGGYSILNATNQPTSYNGSSRACTGAAKLAVSATTAAILGSTLRVTSEVKGINLQFSTPEALGWIANLKNPANPADPYEYALDFRGFRLSLAFVQ